MDTLYDYDPALLLAARGAANLTQKQVAVRVSLLRGSARARISRVTVAMWEGGGSCPNIETLGFLAAALGTDPNGLYHARPISADAHAGA